MKAKMAKTKMTIKEDIRTKQHHCNFERITKLSQAQDQCTLGSRVKVSQVQGQSVPSSEENVSQVPNHYISFISKINSSISEKQSGVILHIIERLEQIDEMSIPDMMLLVGWTNRTRFRTTIINPLVADGLICPVYLDKPTHPNQKYRLTEKAREQMT